ncbi:ChaB family protein [Priestia koreensis]|uniref:ChaB family protein n=1 Tax=Priestia koreensis TaxID=284581 RepID=UPI001F5985AA|nr:ChaB family protein [Priestia koreensis]MCM3005063.1 ChaB family protein [Priestia koreensis]UNL83054.1 ChaB family protein [Priestia koreensis]
MSYTSLKDLPKSVTDHLPHHAQEIYKKAFNSATKEYDEDETAHQVAWSAVEQTYYKNEDGKWVEK